MTEFCETTFANASPLQIHHEDEEQDAVVVEFSEDTLVMKCDGMEVAVEDTFQNPCTVVRITIPLVKAEKTSLFGTKSSEMAITWKLVERCNNLYLHWTIAEDFDANMEMPKELAVKTVFGERKVSATGKGFKYEVQINTSDMSDNKFTFVCGEECLPVYVIYAFLENCLQPLSEVMVLLHKYHPRTNVPCKIVRFAEPVEQDDDDAFDDDAFDDDAFDDDAQSF